jgi:RNA polymerase-binding transcription factor DksA
MAMTEKDEKDKSQYGKCAYCGKSMPFKLLKLRGVVEYSLRCRDCKHITSFHVEHFDGDVSAGHE